jgi:hypothetical protein
MTKQQPPTPRTQAYGAAWCSVGMACNEGGLQDAHTVVDLYIVQLVFI